MSDNGEPLPGVRLLIERDAFSGEGSIDLDEDTYWIPIGFTDADEQVNGLSTHLLVKLESQHSLVLLTQNQQELVPSMMVAMLKESTIC